MSDELEMENTITEDSIHDRSVKPVNMAKEVKNNCGLKVLGNGELKVALTVKAAKFSENAKAAIEAAQGTAEIL